MFPSRFGTSSFPARRVLAASLVICSACTTDAEIPDSGEASDDTDSSATEADADADTDTESQSAGDPEGTDSSSEADTGDETEHGDDETSSTSASDDPSASTDGGETQTESEDEDEDSSETGDLTPQEFRCTLVIGDPQLLDWFPAFEAQMDDGRWQAQSHLEGSIDRWADPEFEGWSTEILSPCDETSDAPDRAMIIVGGDLQIEGDWGRGMEDTMFNLEQRYPALGHWIFDAVVAGPADETCEIDGVQVLSAKHHIMIVHSIGHIAGIDDKVMGPGLRAEACSAFVDVGGRLEAEAATRIGGRLAEHWAGIAGSSRR